jgi:hypothetical protein
MFFLWGSYIFCCEYVVFGRGCIIFLVCGVLLTKKKVVHTTLCTTYVDKKQSKTPSTSHFFGRMCNVLNPLYRCMRSFVEIQH